MNLQNPYVGPKSFEEEERDRFFGREREARDLLAQVVSERLVLYYAQSGAGKTSLLRARLIPSLREQGFDVLPIGRVSGELPSAITPEQVSNIFILNLILSLNTAQGTAALPIEHLVSVTLAAFLTGEVNAVASSDASTVATSDTTDYLPTVLIIDQFEELLLTHINRWPDRVGFFQQLRQCLDRFPNLWVVLTLREDYVAGLDPYVHLLANRLISRYYMQRLGVAAALEAIQRPAADIGGGPFEPGVAETLVDNLRRLKGSEQGAEQLGQYVEPVQLQVVCYQLWENLFGSEQAQSAQPARVTISLDDLERGGDVDTALADFYGDAIKAVLALETLAISERTLRIWFDKYLITEEGTRGTVYRGEEMTAGMPNAVVDVLQDHFLLRSELRAGGTWVELVHDRFVEPMQRANRTWRVAYYNPVAVACERWMEGGRTDDRLLRGDHLQEAITFAAKNPVDITEEERIFLQRSQGVAKQRVYQRRLLIGGAVTLLFLFASLAWYGLDRANAARQAQAEAEANAKLANQQLARLEGLKFLQEAEQFSATGKIKEAIAAYKKAIAFDSTLGIDLVTVTQKVYRRAAFLHVQAGERFASQGELTEASASFQAALVLNPPPSTPLYIWIQSGAYRMGSADNDLAATDIEKPQHNVFLSGFWIMATEVTNLQYRSCVTSGACDPPANNRYLNPLLDDWPVSNVSWNQALRYAKWVGGRLPTEAEWEKACRGTDARIYPWGNMLPSPKLLNFSDSDGIWTTVGSYPEGQSFYGLMDMAGSIMEWTSTLWGSGEDALWTPDFFYPYKSDDGREATDAPADVYRVVRNGAFDNSDVGVFRCAFRQGHPPSTVDIRIGFRVVSSAAPP